MLIVPDLVNQQENVHLIQTRQHFGSIESKSIGFFEYQISEVNVRTNHLSTNLFVSVVTFKKRKKMIFLPEIS